MELHEIELQKAKQLLSDQGKAADSYSFDISFLPPDPDAAGMFTVRYSIVITNSATGKQMKTIGGIGLNWVGHFKEALAEGYFD